MPRPSKPTGSPSYPKRKAMAKMAPFTPNRTKRQTALNRQELKALDTGISTVVDTTTEVINQIATVVQGDSFNNRDGATILVKSIQITGRITQVPAAAATSAPIFYLWIVLDRQPNGAALVVTDFLTSQTANLALPVVPNQFRFKTLGRICIPMNTGAGVTTAYNNYSQPVEWYYKFKTPLEIRYNGNAGTVADLATNGLSLVCGAADSDDTIAFNGTCRIRFTG